MEPLKQTSGNQEVLNFIKHFKDLQNDPKATDVLITQFSAGYCYQFAHMLKGTFKRGSVCIASPYGHCVWLDTDGISYDIYGVFTDDDVTLIHESEIGPEILDFTHTQVPSKSAQKYVPFGSFCRSLRIINNELLYDMAQKLNTSCATLSKAENGCIPPESEWQEILVRKYHLDRNAAKTLDKIFQKTNKLAQIKGENNEIDG